MGLSSNILWHQTDFDGLRGILESGCLYFSYSKEIINNRIIAIPMISLCDLPFSDLGEYLGKYGDYTIGFERMWGVIQGFNPVWYYEKESDIKSFLSRQDLAEPLKQINAYTKPVDGTLTTRKMRYFNYRFYDEHEVRCVATEEMMAEYGLPWSLSEAEYDEYKKAHNNSSLTPISRGFPTCIIKYIIVKSEREISKYFHSYIEDYHIPVFTQGQVKKDFIGVNHSVGKKNTRNYPPSVSDDYSHRFR